MIKAVAITDIFRFFFGISGSDQDEAVLLEGLLRILLTHDAQ
jgi:hypothetical protein